MNQLEHQAYLQRLSPWCIIKPLANMQRQVVGRFRNRSDAEGHLQVLSRLVANATYIIVFDPPLEPPDSIDT
ncbi:hypothetical protein [Lyngbya aestuarii]|uniref:hypothetical protein n=1 Tax=Lyngbya aestuarii TaxID=118322 RepID=UPI00403DA888